MEPGAYTHMRLDILTSSHPQYIRKWLRVNNVHLFRVFEFSYVAACRPSHTSKTKYIAPGGEWYFVNNYARSSGCVKWRISHRMNKITCLFNLYLIRLWLWCDLAFVLCASHASCTLIFKITKYDASASIFVSTSQNNEMILQLFSGRSISFSHFRTCWSSSICPGFS